MDTSAWKSHSMVEARAVIASFFITLKQDVYVLIRIESLVALVTVMFLVVFIMDIFRCRSRSSIITTTMKIANGLSDQMVAYLFGAMQSTKFKNQLFPVWAIVLVSLRSSLGYLSGYSIRDRERRWTEISNVIKFTATGVLNGTRALQFTKPLWSLWTILTLRSLYRYFAHGWAVESLWHGKSSEFLPGYLSRECIAEGAQNPNNSENSIIKCPVYGESKQKVSIKPPNYTDLHVIETDSFITLDKIWHNCPEYKDISLAFSLSRLLRCRFEDVSLPAESIPRTRNLIIFNVINNQSEDAQSAQSEDQTAERANHSEDAQSAQSEDQTAERAFRILEYELAFVRDYFYTLYPMVFSRGLFSLWLSVLMSAATFFITLWLAVGIRKVSKLPVEDNFALWKNGCNVDVIMTLLFLFFMMCKEAWEIFTYLFSNWTQLLLVCKHVWGEYWCLGSTCLMRASSFFNSKVTGPWHGRIDQYEFLQSCTYKPTFWKLAHTVTLGKTPKKFDGRKSGDTIKIHKCVKKEVLQQLRRLELKGQPLRREIPTLVNAEISFDRYKWAWFDMSNSSQSILVWNIATSLCEIKLAQDKNIDLSKPSFLCSVWSWLKKRVCCSSQPPFLVDEKTSLEGRLKDNYHIANSLSRYCGYLLAFRSELLPDSFIVPEVILETTLDDASKNLKDCELKRCRYNKLMALAQEALLEVEKGNMNMNIVQQGAMLAKDLIEKEISDEHRWEILAGVWTKLLVHIAPSWNAEAHRYNLESGGEFITLIWALLWHCGIEKSDMWKQCRESENNAPAPEENNTETINPQSVEEQNDSEIPEEPETSKKNEQAQMESISSNTVSLSTSTN